MNSPTFAATAKTMPSSHRRIMYRLPIRVSLPIFVSLNDFWHPIARFPEPAVDRKPLRPALDLAPVREPFKVDLPDAVAVVALPHAYLAVSRTTLDAPDLPVDGVRTHAASAEGRR